MAAMTQALEQVEETFEAGGRRLFARRWLPAGPPKAHLLIVHGYAEHSGRYAWTGERLAEAGYAAHAVDLPAHGRSDGVRALLRSLDPCVDAVRALAAGVEGATPRFLLGHSMGGTVVALGAVERAWDARGLVLSGPALTPGRRARLQELIVRTLALIAPRMGIVELPADAVSRDPGVVRAYDADPLVYRGKIRAATLVAMLSAQRRIAAAMEHIAQPLLIVHGGDDRLVSPEGSRVLAARAGSADRTLRIYDGLYHEVLNEPERESVLADIVSWIDERL